ncbi:putative RNA-binding protein sce3 [Ceratocystis fimbriata CBS 114723]|uniref:Putative RNA-binding protein sce3 n=1 Tax=Ceratocystis fimbriata CBS 114723 TaxID=1035309 RepID=A0A2C5XBD5_9PEZI|nr:putative RNA-binding protein sce3 [Ceratocystis fimbriata CBS 114723]
MSLGDFMNDSAYGGSWADDVEDDIMTGTQALPMPERRTYGGGSGYGNSGGYNSYGGDRDRDRGERFERNYAPRNLGPQEIPDKPPYTAHLGNLSYEVTADSVIEFFQPSEIVSVRIIEDRENMRPKGFAYAEFKTPEGLKAALELDSTSFQGRSIRVKIADPPRDRPEGHSSGRDLDWTRKGPLADLPNTSNRNANREFTERRAPREPAEDRGIRELGTWERKGPLSPAVREDSAREGGRPQSNQNSSGERSDSFRGNNRREGASWGEGNRQPGGEQNENSRPPRPERAPTAAERDNQWRSNMRPDNAVAAAATEAPASPATSTVPTRPLLKLQKRTAVDTAEEASPVVSSSKSNPFGAARPIDTSAREREPKSSTGPRNREQHPREQKPSRAAESGNWRSSATRGNGPTGPRRGDNRGPRGGRQDGGANRGHRGDGSHRGEHRHGGHRGDNHRDIRDQHSVPSTPVTASAPESGAAAAPPAASPAAAAAPASASGPAEDDGWTTVSVPRGKRNGRAVV